MTQTERRVVLVTGASTGFGRLTVEALARRGHCVYAALRDVGGRNREVAAELTALASAEGVDLRVVELDVTDQSSADRAIATVVAEAGRIDAVVNNAGMIFPGPIEAFTADEATRQFDVNVFGALRVGRAVLPQLRGQGSGVLIQIGSISGRVTLPFSGMYAASKAALGSITDAWHHELAPFGVESVIVEPASYPTNIGANAVLPEDMARMGVYGEAMGAMGAGLTKRYEEGADDPGVVADAIVELVEAANGTRPRWTVVAPEVQAQVLQPLSVAAGDAALVVAEDMGVGASMVRPEQGAAA